jgi:NADH-quinone oxidoreductase subunit N
MNLGALAVVIAVARKTPGRHRSYGGLVNYARTRHAHDRLPGVTAGVPPTAGFVAKLGAFRALRSAQCTGATMLAIVGAVNSIIAFGYYGRVMREMWMNDVPDGDTTPVRIPQPLTVALAITVAATMLMGILPQVILRFGDLGNLVGAVGQ